MGTTVEAVEQLQEALTRQPISLEQPLSQEGDGRLEDVIEQVMVSPIEEATAELLKDDLSTALQVLPPREREIITLRYGLRDRQQRTLEEVGPSLQPDARTRAPDRGARPGPAARIAGDALAARLPAQRGVS